jgi:hypothetical protein
MNISFYPSPQYSGIALAASGGPGRALGEGLFARTVAGVRDFEDTLREALRAVEAGRGAFIEATLERRK